MLGIASPGFQQQTRDGGAMELLQVLKNGDDVAITPDGPRARFTPSTGAAALALKAKAPVILVARTPKSDGGEFWMVLCAESLQSHRMRLCSSARRTAGDRDASAALLRKDMLALTEDLKSPPRVA
jgi:hypothetical protein